MPAAQSFNAPDDLIELGHIVSAYGVKGWIKVQPYSAQANVLLDADVWWLKAPASLLGTGALSRPFPAKVTGSRHQGASIVACLDNVADRSGAELMKGHTVCAPRSAFPPCAPDEYYWVDLIGCQLWGERNEAPELIGKVLDVLDNGAHALLRVARATPGPEGQCLLREDAKGRTIDVLVPFVDAHVHTVDLANKRLYSNWPADF